MPPNSFIQCEDPAFQTKIIVREGNPEFEFYTELRAPFQDALKLKVFHRAYNKDHQAELYRNQMIGECTLNLKQHILDFRQAKDLIDHTLRKKVRIVIGSTEQYVGYKALATTNQLQPQLDAEIDICQGETFPEEPSHPGAEEPSLEINERNSPEFDLLFVLALTHTHHLNLASASLLTRMHNYLPRSTCRRAHTQS